MRAFFERALSELRSGRRVYTCFVAANRKGSPGTPAAHMLLTELGEQVGTIGGGIMEQRVLEAAAHLLQSDAAVLPRLQHLKHQKTASDASGLICGGGQSNVFLILEPSELQIGLLERVIETYGAQPDACLVFRPDGMAVESVVLEHVGRRSLNQHSNEDWVFYLPLFNARRVVIFGGGHCGRALADQMDRLGYSVVVVEPRADLFTLDGLSDSVSLISQDYARAADLIAQPEYTHAVVMTYSLPTDVEALLGVLKHDFLTVGVMGSRPKIVRIHAELKEFGVAKDKVDSVRAPIGLSFDSDTPEEIAVSIAAQILLERTN